MRVATAVLLLALLVSVGCAAAPPPSPDVETREENTRLLRLIDELNRKLAELEARVAEMEKFFKPGQVETTLDMPSIGGQVMAVSKTYDIVLISAGSEDGVQVGYEFTIFRGDQYVGKVVVNEVERDYCAGYSQKDVERMAIEKGDGAKTRF